MSWLKRSFSWVTGGDKAGLQEAVEAAIRGRENIDPTSLSEQFCVQQNAVRWAITQRLKEEAEAYNRSDLLGNQRLDLLRYAELVGAEVSSVRHALQVQAALELTRELQSQFDGGAVDLDHLLKLGDGMGLTAQEVRTQASTFAKPQLEQVITEILADGEVSPNEDEYLNKVMNRLAVDSITGSAKTELERARYVWSAAHGPLPVVEPPILLQRNEVCHHAIQAEALENRSRTVAVSYGGPRARIRIAKGLSYTLGSISVARHTEEYQHSFGRGVLCATNKRLLWIGLQKSLSIKLDSIVQYQAFNDGFLIRKATGKPLTFAYCSGSDIIATTLIARVIEEQR